MSAFFQALKDPSVVAKFQELCGIEFIDDSVQEKNGDACSGGDNCHNSASATNGIRKRHKEDKPKAEVGRSLANGYVDLSHPRDQAEWGNHVSEAGRPYRVNNKMWYYLFCFGSSLGGELFYITFFPFWFWNIDYFVSRRVIVVWAFTMYLGQSAKDIIRWPRPPSPPVAKIERTFDSEYGFPSTHAIVAFCIPFTFVYWTVGRYEYWYPAGYMIGAAWCLLVCVSRLYVGMHNILDVLAGLTLSVLLTCFITPWLDTIDHFNLHHPYSPLLVVSSYFMLCLFYPSGGQWNTARGDTAMIVGTCAGVIYGAWINTQYNLLLDPSIPPPYKVIWPNIQQLGLFAVRFVLGGIIAGISRAVVKPLTLHTVCRLFGESTEDPKARSRAVVEVPYKFFTYGFLGLMVVCVIPIVFRVLGIASLYEIGYEQAHTPAL
ncbi:PREDICTED: sphingosine-1-phosphate phosphatase 1-like [Branchiostoma belcheri]|uniref:Sphingosine-1-phosphate phosphatase 1-like n=1 Tax=Branchiostoma belcheri TaxID=7741 RepID=A0A6P4Y5I4_BRABE|nr:PREDICTED: sphingosine-1-phosphate phosphatase 1-like [Branchiostoma belcheri]